MLLAGAPRKHDDVTAGVHDKTQKGIQQMPQPTKKFTASLYKDILHRSTLVWAA